MDLFLTSEFLLSEPLKSINYAFSKLDDKARRFLYRLESQPVGSHTPPTGEEIRDWYVSMPEKSWVHQVLPEPIWTNVKVSPPWMGGRKSEISKGIPQINLVRFTRVYGGKLKEPPA